MLWARDSEVVFFPESHHIEHGTQGSQARWGYIPSKEKLESCKHETREIAEGAL